MANPRKFSEKIALLNQKQAEETAAFEAIMREVSDVTSKTALNSLEEMQHNPMIYRSGERGRSMGVGPMRSRPMEKRYDTSPYSGTYLSPPTPDTWRRTNSDSALHQSANEACQSSSPISHRRGSDAYQHAMGKTSNDNRDGQYGGTIERPRSSCEVPRVPGIYIYPSSQPPGPQTPIGNNTGSLPDLSNVHFPSPLHTPLDQEDHSSSTQYSNNHLSVPVNSRFLHTCKGLGVDNNRSISQGDLRQSYVQQTSQPPLSTSHSPGHHYIYQQPHSPVPPQSPKASQSQQQQNSPQQSLNSLSSYRTSQPVNRPSPQSSPTINVQGSPLSYSNNPSAPPSPTGHPGPPNFTSDSIDQNSYFINQAQAAALQQTFEQFNMMESTVDSLSSYIGSTNDTSNFTQNDMINVGGDLGSNDTSYYSTSPQMGYNQPRTPNNTQQLTPQTPNTPTIILTDFSGTDDLTNSEYAKDISSTITSSDFDPSLFTSDDALRDGLEPLDLDGLQMLTDPETVVLSDANAEDVFRLDCL